MSYRDKLAAMSVGAREDLVLRLTAAPVSLEMELVGAGWSRLELLELHAAAVRGTMRETAPNVDGWCNLLTGIKVDRLMVDDPEAPIIATAETLEINNLDTAPVLTLREAADQHVLAVYRLSNGNKVRTARALGIDRRSLYRHLIRLGVHVTAARAKAESDERADQADAVSL